MRVLLGLLPALTLFIALPTADAGQFWLDGNGDGFPDMDWIQNPAPGTIGTFDLWMDTQSFVFTGFRLSVDHDPSLERVSADYAIAGGTNAPVDSTTRPSGTIFAGAGYSSHGLFKVAVLKLRIVSCVCPWLYPVTCVTDPLDPTGSRLTGGSGSTNFYFESERGNGFDCEPVDWGIPCCLPGGGCVYVPSYSPWECAAAGGRLLAPCADCATCALTGVAGDASESKSWGRVKALFR